MFPLKFKQKYDRSLSDYCDGATLFELKLPLDKKEKFLEFPGELMVKNTSLCKK